MSCKCQWATECKRGCKDVCDIKALQLYRPSNGTEGMVFQENFCDHCIHENPDPNGKKKCDIVTAAMCFYPTDKEYPNEWRYDALGYPTCTKYVNWDWDSNGDPDDPDNPIAPPPPPDPNQIALFPLYPDERNYVQIVSKEVQHHG